MSTPKYKIWQCKDEPDKVLIESQDFNFHKINNPYANNGWRLETIYESLFENDPVRALYLYSKQKGQKNEQRNL